jgi:hypothetical protein
MGKSIPVTPKRRGRPATGRDPHITARLPEEMIRDLDRLAHQKGVTRSEILRDLVGPALAAKLKAAAKR